jgi:purine nucleosidase
MIAILLDTDLAMGAPGSDIDDGFALALALAETDLRVELVTTVHGNTDVDTATRLTGELLARFNRADLPLVRGASIPLDPKLRGTVSAREDPSATEGGDAAAAIVEAVMSQPGARTIVALGPLTNVALALLLEPRVASAVKSIVVMGGVYLGQTNVAAMPGEFNFWCDPVAAAIVLASGAPLRLVGLDVTSKVRLTREDAHGLAQQRGDFARFAGTCTEEWITHQERVKPNEKAEHGSCALHDPLAVAVVVRPDLVSWRPAYVQVETSSALTRGVAVADLLMWENPPAANCEIATTVDADEFRRWFFDRMASLP